MFKNEFQGGSFMKVLWANSKDPLNKWKNPALKRDFDKDVKGYIYILEGSTTTSRLQYPSKDIKQSLCLIQRFLIIQVFIPLSKDFAVELVFTDIGNNKRRVLLSTSVKDISPTPLHAKLPLSYVMRDVWLNLCFDLVSLISDVFPGQTFKSLEHFCISGNCKFRQAFTMKNQPIDDSSGLSDDPPTVVQYERISSQVQYVSTLRFYTQVVSVPRIRLYLGTKLSARGDNRETSGYWSSSSDDLASSRKLSARDQAPTHIAFGTKVPVNSARNPKLKQSLSSSLNKARNSMNISSTDTDVKPVVRKVRSSNPRLSVRGHVSDKENSNDKYSSLIPTAVPALVERTSKKKLKDLNNISKERVAKEDPHLNELPSMLASLVDEFDISEEQNPNLEETQSSSTVFKFFSEPHSVSRTRTESGSTSNEPQFEEDFMKSSSDSDETDSIQDLIVRPTPSPRNKITVSPISRISQDFMPTRSVVKIPSQPLASMSPDISRLQSPTGRLYDSKKYSDGYHTRTSNTIRNKPPISHVMSMRSSDATLTASVDTLVQASTRESSEGIGDSLDDRDVKSSNLLQSDTSPPEVKPIQSFNGSQMALICRKSMKEIKSNSIHTNPALLSSHFEVASLSDSFEANMLASMKRETEEEMSLEESKFSARGNISFRDEFDDSFDTSWSKQPPSMRPEAYESEMKKNRPSDTLTGFTLGQSNPRDWANLLSPPTVFPSERAQQKKESLSDVESIGNDMDSMGLSNGSSTTTTTTTGGETDEEEMLDLLYDPCLNCYFDPKTGKYYELKT